VSWYITPIHIPQTFGARAPGVVVCVLVYLNLSIYLLSF
jgi:hypothetical protein